VFNSYVSHQLLPAARDRSTRHQSSWCTWTR